WRKFGSGKAVEDIVTLFTQRRPEIARLPTSTLLLTSRTTSLLMVA
ncbi:hypothetical protein O5166_26165, partial [Escherichia coli]|nr:hypothetical protein [Escherichia coli]